MHRRLRARDQAPARYRFRQPDQCQLEPLELPRQRRKLNPIIAERLGCSLDEPTGRANARPMINSAISGNPHIASLMRATRSRSHSVAFERAAACLAEPRPVGLKTVLNRAVIAEILPAKAL